MVTVFVTTISTIGSSLFVIVVLVQVKVYGFRTWIATGLGTGLDTKEAKTKEEDRIEHEAHLVVQELEREGKKLEHDI